MTSSRIHRALLLSGVGGPAMAACCWLRDGGIPTVLPRRLARGWSPPTCGRPGSADPPTLTDGCRPSCWAGWSRRCWPDPRSGRVSIDWGRNRREPFGGTTLLLAADGWDTGDVVYTATYPYPDEPATKSWIYSHLNRIAMLRGLEQVVGPADARPLDYHDCDVLGTWNDPMRQGDCGVDWSMRAEDIVWRAAARDGAPGVLAELLGRPCPPVRCSPWRPDEGGRGQRGGVDRRRGDPGRGRPARRQWPAGKRLGRVVKPGARCGRATHVQAAWCMVATRRDRRPAAQRRRPTPSRAWDIDRSRPSDTDPWRWSRPRPTTGRGPPGLSLGGCHDRRPRSPTRDRSDCSARRRRRRFGNEIHLNHIYGASAAVASGAPAPPCVVRPRPISGQSTKWGWHCSGRVVAAAQ